jgi:DNA-binding transcriptional MerR regulator/effector-binding domain-containing protein
MDFIVWNAVLWSSDSIYHRLQSQIDEYSLTLQLGEDLRSETIERGPMFSIGQFSRITGLTIKTIRLYHEKELLIPKLVDESTGYRHFDDRNIEQARAISYLRELMFSLAEIKEMLDHFTEDSDILEFLEKHRNAIHLKMEQLNKAALSLEDIIQQEKEAKKMLKESSFSVGEKEIDDFTVAGLRWKGKYSDVGKAFQQLWKLAGKHIRGKPMNLYYDGEYKEEDADIETCFRAGNLKHAGALSVHTLPGGKCVYLIHKGPYEQLSRSYAKIMDHIQKKKYQTLLPIREIYLKGPGMIFRGNPKNYLTEIQIMTSHGKEGGNE